jgi:methylenetetrahydrofolate reductase (NADPH)
MEAGAEFVQTLPVYDAELFKYFTEYARQVTTKLLAGVICLIVAQMARFMNKNVPGINVLQDFIDKLAAGQKAGR